MSGVEVIRWSGGPYDGEEIGVPIGCEALSFEEVVTPADTDDVLSVRRTTIPIRRDTNGGRALWYEGVPGTEA